MKTIEKQPVSSIMTTNLIKLNTSDTLYKAKEMFKKNDIRHLPVVSYGELVGILSFSDVTSLEYGETYGESDDTIPLIDMLKVYQIMKPTPKTVAPNMSIKEVAQLLIISKIHALPVLEDDELVGIVTTTDIIEYFLLKAQ